MADSHDWHGIGYARGISSCVGGSLNGLYPTQDKYTPADELAFIDGFNQARHDHATTGLRPCMFYVQEKGQGNATSS